MAGLGIRCWELARTLSAHASVTVAHGGSERSEADGIRTIPFRPHAPHPLRALIEQADVVIAHPQWPLVDRWLKRSPARVVIPFSLRGRLPARKPRASGLQGMTPIPSSRQSGIISRSSSR